MARINRGENVRTEKKQRTTLQCALLLYVATVCCCGVSAQHASTVKVKPEFRDFPSTPMRHAPRVRVWNIHKLTGSNREDMLHALSKPANFAGHYTLFDTNCGTSCASIFIIDRISGRVWNPDHDARGVLFRADSRLLIIDPPMSFEVNTYDRDVGDTLPVRYFVWEKNHLRLVWSKPCQVVGQHQVCGNGSQGQDTKKP